MSQAIIGNLIAFFTLQSKENFGLFFVIMTIISILAFFDLFCKS